jgi:hypothetical protein
MAAYPPILRLSKSGLKQPRSLSDKTLVECAHELRPDCVMGLEQQTDNERPCAAAGWNRYDVCALVAALTVTAAVLGKDVSRGSMIDPDAAAHAMDGVLIHDWIKAGPAAWLSPMAFAREQYGHYPTLGIGGHYPPGFAVVEAAFFLLFGVSTTTARWCVLLFGLVSAAGTYVFVRPLAGRGVAALAAILLIGLPATTHWGRQIMLEVPLMATLIWSAIALGWYACRPGWARLCVAAAATLLTLAFKQSGIFLICATAITLGWEAYRGRASWKHAVFVAVLAMVSLGGILLTLDQASLKTVSGYSTVPLLSFASILFYVKSLPDQVGWGVLIGGIAGIALATRRTGIAGVLLAAWLFVAWVMITGTSLKTPRFGYVLVFPLVVGAALAAGRLLAALPGGRWHAIGTAVGVAAVAWIGLARPVTAGPEFGPLVQEWRDGIDGQVVLFSGLRDGDFVFAVRERIPWRSSVVIRGSKLFYTCVAPPSLDMVSYVQSPKELSEVMRRYAFRDVFVERENLVGAPQDDWLRAYLQSSGDYTLADTKVVDGRQIRGKRMIHIDRYRLARPLERQVDFFDIPVPRTRDTIRIPIPPLAGRDS